MRCDTLARKKLERKSGYDIQKSSVSVTENEKDSRKPMQIKKIRQGERHEKGEGL